MIYRAYKVLENNYYVILKIFKMLYKQCNEIFNAFNIYVRNSRNRHVAKFTTKSFQADPKLTNRIYIKSVKV